MNWTRRKESWGRRLGNVRPWTIHTSVLFVGGLTYIAVGLSKIIFGIPESREQALVFALNFFPIEIWGSIFIVMGLFAAITSKWFHNGKRWGYFALTGFSTIWGLFHIEGIIFTSGVNEALSAGLLWSLIAFMWWALGSLEPTDSFADGP